MNDKTGSTRHHVRADALLNVSIATLGPLAAWTPGATDVLSLDRGHSRLTRPQSLAETRLVCGGDRRNVDSNIESVIFGHFRLLNERKRVRVWVLLAYKLMYKSH